MITTRNLLASVATAALIAGAAGAANAAFTIDSTTATFGVIPSGTESNDALPALDPLFGAGATTLDGWYGATISTNTAGTVTIEFLGSEAGFNNRFLWEGDVQFSTGGNTNNFSDPVGTAAGPFAVGAEVLDFAFGINSEDADLTNAANPDDSGGTVAENFFSSFNVGNNDSVTSGSVLYLFLDDGGAGPDDNHDDMVMRLTFTADPEEVAEPVTLGILGLGLAGIGLMARRRRLV